MKIVGGSFGLSGRALIDDEGRLVVKGDRQARFSSDQISTVAARTEKDKKFGCFSFIIGAVMLSILFGIFLNVIGVAIGIILAAMGSFYTNSKNIVDLSLDTGETLSLECSSRQVRKLVSLKA